jgi:hypothetical protein
VEHITSWQSCSALCFELVKFFSKVYIFKAKKKKKKASGTFRQCENKNDPSLKIRVNAVMSVLEPNFPGTFSFAKAL